jgi:hypothetical protein
VRLGECREEEKDLEAGLKSCLYGAFALGEN